MSQQEYWNAYWENACDPQSIIKGSEKSLSINLLNVIDIQIMSCIKYV